MTRLVARRCLSFATILVLTLTASSVSAQQDQDSAGEEKGVALKKCSQCSVPFTGTLLPPSMVAQIVLDKAKLRTLEVEVASAAVLADKTQELHDALVASLRSEVLRKDDRVRELERSQAGWWNQNKLSVGIATGAILSTALFFAAAYAASN